MIENSTQGLTVLDADLDVQVVDIDRAALAAWAPEPGRPARRVAAELAATGDARGRKWIEVRIDGVPVGVLPADAAQRHARHIDAVLHRAGRPAANGLVLPGPRLELRLPDPAAPVRAPLPPAGPPAARPDALGLYDRLPSERRPSRTPVLVGAGVLALLLAVGVAVGVRPGGEPTASGPAVIRITTPAPVPTTAPTTTTPPAPTTAEEEAEPVVRPTRSRRPAVTRTPAAVAPAPTTEAPVLTPTPTSAAEPPGELLDPTRPGLVRETVRPRRANGVCEDLAAVPPDPDCDEGFGSGPG